jgi:hypothetical protein
MIVRSPLCDTQWRIGVSSYDFLSNRLLTRKNGDDQQAISNLSTLARLIKAHLFHPKNGKIVCNLGSSDADSFVSLLITLTEIGMQPNEARKLLLSPRMRLSAFSYSTEAERKLITTPEFIAFIKKNEPINSDFWHSSVVTAVINLSQSGRCSVETLEAGLKCSSWNSIADFYKAMAKFVHMPEETLRTLLQTLDRNIGLIASLDESLFQELLKHESLVTFLIHYSYGCSEGLAKLVQLTQDTPLSAKHLQQIAALYSDLYQSHLNLVFIDLYTRLCSVSIPVAAQEALLEFDYRNQHLVQQRLSQLNDEEITLIFSSQAVIDYIKEDELHFTYVCQNDQDIIKMQEQQMLNAANLKLLRHISFDHIMMLKKRGMQEHVIRMIKAYPYQGSIPNIKNPFYSVFISPAFAALDERHTSLAFFLSEPKITKKLDEAQLLTSKHVAVLARIEGSESNWSTFCAVLLSKKNKVLNEHINASFILESIDALYQLSEADLTPEEYKDLINRVVNNIKITYHSNKALSTELPKTYLSDPVHLNLEIIRFLQQKNILTSGQVTYSLRVPSKVSTLYCQCIEALHEAGVVDTMTIRYVIDRLRAGDVQILDYLRKMIIPALALLKKTYNHIPQDSYSLVLTSQNSDSLAQELIALKQIPLANEDYQHYLNALHESHYPGGDWLKIFANLKTVMPHDALTYKLLMADYDILFPQFSLPLFKRFLFVKLGLMQVALNAENQVMVHAWLRDEKNDWPEFVDVLKLLSLCEQVKTLPCYEQHKNELNSPYKMLYRGELLCVLVQNDLYGEIDSLPNHSDYYYNINQRDRALAWGELKQHGLYPEYREYIGNSTRLKNNIIHLKKLGLLIEPFIKKELLSYLPDCEGLELLQEAYLKSNNPVYRDYQIHLLENKEGDSWSTQKRDKKYSATNIKAFIRLVEHELYSPQIADEIFSPYQYRRSAASLVDTLIFIKEQKDSLGQVTINSLKNGTIRLETITALKKAGIYEYYADYLSHFYNQADYVAQYVIYMHSHDLLHDFELLKRVTMHIQHLPFVSPQDSSLIQVLLALKKQPDFLLHAKAMLQSCEPQRYSNYLTAIELLVRKGWYEDMKKVLFSVPNQALNTVEQIVQLHQKGIFTPNREALLKDPLKTNELCSALLNLGPDLYEPYKEFILANPSFALAYSQGCRALFDHGFTDEGTQSYLLVNPQKADQIAKLLIVLKHADLYEETLIVDLLELIKKGGSCSDNLITALSDLKKYDQKIYEEHCALLVSAQHDCLFLADLLIHLHASAIYADKDLIISTYLSRCHPYFSPSINASAMVAHLNQLKITDASLYQEHKLLLLRNMLYTKELTQALIILKTTGIYDSHEASTAFAALGLLTQDEAKTLSYILDAEELASFYLSSYKPASIATLYRIIKLIYIAKHIQSKEPVDSCKDRDQLLMNFKKSLDDAEIYLQFCEVSTFSELVFKSRNPNPYDLAYCLKRMPVELQGIFLEKLHVQVYEIFSNPGSLEDFLGFFKPGDIRDGLKTKLNSMLAKDNSCSSVQQTTASTIGFFAYKETQTVNPTEKSILEQSHSVLY